MTPAQSRISEMKVQLMFGWFGGLKVHLVGTVGCADAAAALRGRLHGGTAELQCRVVLYLCTQPPPTSILSPQAMSH